MKGTNSIYKGFAIVAAMSMATIGVFSRWSDLPAEQVTFFRLGIGGAFLALLILSNKKQWRISISQWLHCAVLGLFLAGFILFYIQAMNWTTMANAILFVYLAPIVATLLGWLFRKEAMIVTQLALMALAFIGFFIMQFGSDYSGLNRGVVYALLAMLCYAGFIYFNRSLPAQIDAMVGAFWQLSTGAFAVLIVCLLRDISWSLSAEQWGLMLATGFLPGFVALFAAVLALKHLSTSVYGTIAYLEPVTVAFFGWLFFTEILSATQLIGGGLIITAGILQTVFHRPAAAVG